MKLAYFILFLFFELVACNSASEESKVTKMKASDIKVGPVIHDSLTSEQIEKIKKIQTIFAEVYPVSLEETITNFKRDQNPNKEINIWLSMADAYFRFTSSNANVDSTKKQEAFNLLLLRSMMTDKEALEEAKVKSLSNREVTEILQYYNSIHKPVTVAE